MFDYKVMRVMFKHICLQYIFNFTEEPRSPTIKLNDFLFHRIYYNLFYTIFKTKHSTLAKTVPSLYSFFEIYIKTEINICQQNKYIKQSTKSIVIILYRKQNEFY
jgi:hypothetical protein